MGDAEILRDASQRKHFDGFTINGFARCFEGRLA